MNKDGKDNKDSKDIDQLLNNLLGHIDQQEQRQAQRATLVNNSGASDEAFRRVEEIAQDVEQDQSWKIPHEIPRPPIPPAPQHEPVVVPPPVSHFSDAPSQNPAVRMRDRLDESRLPRTPENAPAFRAFQDVPDPPRRVITPVDVSDVMPKESSRQNFEEKQEKREEVVRSRAEMIREQLRIRRAEEEMANAQRAKAESAVEKETAVVAVSPKPEKKSASENAPVSKHSPKSKKSEKPKKISPPPPEKDDKKEKSSEKKPSLFQKLFNKKEKESSNPEPIQEEIPSAQPEPLQELHDELKSIFEDDISDSSVPESIAPAEIPVVAPEPAPSKLPVSFGFDDDDDDDFDDDDYDDDFDDDNFDDDDFDDEDEDDEQFPSTPNSSQSESVKKNDSSVPPPPVHLSADFIPDPPSAQKRKERRLNHLSAPEPKKKSSAFSRLRPKKQTEISSESENIPDVAPAPEPAPDWKSLSGVEVPIATNHTIPEVESDEPIQLYTSEETRTAVMVTDLDPLPLPKELLEQNQPEPQTEIQSPVEPEPNPEPEPQNQFEEFPNFAEEIEQPELPVMTIQPENIDDTPRNLPNDAFDIPEDVQEDGKLVDIEQIPDPPSVIWQHMTGVKAESSIPEGETVPDPPSVKKKTRKRMT